MLIERRLIGRGIDRLFLICIVTTFILGSYLFADSEKGDGMSGRTRIFPLKNISATEGKKYLSEIGIETISQIPGSNTLLVTAHQRKLLMASAVLKLVDSSDKFNINTILPALTADSLPANEKIGAETRMLIGTFAHPPRGSGSKAIIDTYKDSVLVIAPIGDFERILGAISHLQDEKKKLHRASKEHISAEKLVMSEEKPISNETVEKSQRQQQHSESDLFGKILEDMVLDTEEETAKEDVLRQKRQEQILRQKQVNLPEKTKTEEAEKSVDFGIRELVSKVAAKTHQLSSDKLVSRKISSESRENEEIETDVVRRSYKPQNIGYDDDMLDLDLPEKLPIGDLLRLMGEYLHLDYMYDSAKVKGDVTLKLRGPIRIKDLYPLLESVLKFRGFVMTRKGNLVTVVPAAEVLNIDPVLLDAKKGQIEVGDVLVTRIFKLKHVSPTNAKNLLTGMKLGTYINPIGATGTLIVTGYAYRMERIEELLAMIDKPGENKEFRFRQLRYTMAKSLTPSVKSLAEQLGTISITVSAPPAAKPVKGRRTPAPKRPAAVSPAKGGSGVYLEADERTNRILMIGLKAQLDTVEQLIDTLDVEQQDLRRIKVYDIQYVGADEIKAKLSELGIISGKGSSDSGRITARRTTSKARPATPTKSSRSGSELLAEPQVIIIDATNSLLVNATEEQHIRIATIISYVDSEMLEESIPYRIYSLENQAPEDMADVLNKLIKETVADKKGKIEKTVKRKEDEDIVIVPDKNTFSIIVYASQKNQRWIANLIKTLDKRRPQVLIDVMLVEITKDDQFKFDLDAVGATPDLLTTSGLTDVASIGTGIMSKLTSRNHLIDFSSSDGTGKGFYGDKHINVLLELMQQKKYGRVLAQPKVLVNDNEEGTINTQTTTYVARTSSSATTTGDTVVSSTTTFDEFSSGIDLAITPHISEGELLRLEIKMSRSEQASASGGTNSPPPDKKENTIETVVTVPDKSTIILGGMQQLNQGKGGGKVPFLGDMPLVGGLFRKLDNTDKQSKLYIFVKAYILRPSETGVGLPDLVRESGKFREAFEKSENQFQEYEEWPGTKSPTLDPLKVLDVR